MTITELCTAAHANSRAKGFYEDEELMQKVLQSHTVNDQSVLLPVVESHMTSRRLALIHAEVSEALEADRKGKYAQCTDRDIERSADSTTNEDGFSHFYSRFVKGSFEEELADIIIRVADLAGGKGIDLESHVKAKMRYNSMREYKHGKQY